MMLKIKRKIFFRCFILLAAAFLVFCYTGVDKAYALDSKLNMSYIYFGQSSTYTDYVEKTNDSLNQIAPNYFNLNEDGSLLLTNAVSQSFIDQMHEDGILVVPFLSNHWDRQLGKEALLHKEELAVQIANAILAYGLDGINVDLENLTWNEREDYVEFVRLIKEELPAGKIVSVAVAANPYGSEIGWQGSYDYAGLAGYCDYLMVMAYDEHYYNGPAGPVASLSFTEKAIQYALNKVSSDKIVLGIPFYGRIWNDNGAYPAGYGISNSKVEQMIATYGGTVCFDQGTQSSYAKITVHSWDEKPVVGGKTLTAGSYTIWYEDEQTIKQKLALVQEYDLLGTGSWSLGQEADGTWDYYKLWLNGCYFSDIQGHWASGSILKAYQEGWVKGVCDTAFAPEASLTRAQVAVLLVRMLGLEVADDALASFNDTSGHWASDYIETARQNDLISGIGDNLFAPESPVTREQMAVMIDNLAIVSENDGYVSDVSYSDVDASVDSWSYEAVLAMSHSGILQGYPDGTFKPALELTRAQMAVIMGRFSVYLKDGLY